MENVPPTKSMSSCDLGGRMAMVTTTTTEEEVPRGPLERHGEVVVVGSFPVVPVTFESPTPPLIVGARIYCGGPYHLILSVMAQSGSSQGLFR